MVVVNIILKGLSATRSTDAEITVPSAEKKKKNFVQR